MRDNYPAETSSIEKFTHTEMQGCQGSRCAYESAMRVALTNVLFFSFMLLVTFKADVPETEEEEEKEEGEDEERRRALKQSRRDRFENLNVRYRVHVAYWPFKLLLWLAFLCVSFWWVPSESVDVAFQVFRFGTIVAFALAVATFALSFTRYDCDGDKTTVAALSMAIVFVVICCGFSLMEDIRGGLFTSAIVALYVAYLMASASMERSKTCNLVDNATMQSKDEEIIEIVGFVVQLGVVALSAFKAASGHKRFHSTACF